MANMRNIADAFLDGFGSLEFLFQRAERPGSRDNLISPAVSPTHDPARMTKAILAQDANVPDIVFRLRKSADLIESSYEAVHPSTAKQAGVVHGR